MFKVRCCKLAVTGAGPWCCVGLRDHWGWILGCQSNELTVLIATASSPKNAPVDWGYEQNLELWDPKNTVLVL